MVHESESPAGASSPSPESDGDGDPSQGRRRMPARHVLTLAAIFGLPLLMYVIAVLMNRAPPCGPDFAAGAVQRSLVQIAAGSSSDSIVPTGTGFAVSGDGHILTSRSALVDPATGSPWSRILAKLPDGLVLQARLVAADESLDLAVIRVNGAEDLRPVKWTESTYWMVGQPLVAAGFQQMGDGRFAAAPTFIQVERSSPRGLGTATYIEHRAVSAGMLGGPLVSFCGEVVGISVRATAVEPSQWTSLALSSTAARAKIAEWLRQP